MGGLGYLIPSRPCAHGRCHPLSGCITDFVCERNTFPSLVKNPHPLNSLVPLTGGTAVALSITENRTPPHFRTRPLLKVPGVTHT